MSELLLKSDLALQVRLHPFFDPQATVISLIEADADGFLRRFRPADVAPEPDPRERQ